MTALAMDNSFSIFGRTTNQKKGLSNKKTNRPIFEQVIPSNLPNSEPRNQEYLLGDLSAILNNQSLSQEQIVKNQNKIIDEKLEVLSRKYKISKTDEVKSFLSKNRFLISLIEEIPSKIYQYFGNSQKLALQVLYEPDFPESSELWILVLTELSSKEARSIMNRFDKDWWLKNLHKTGCKLNVGIEYV